MNNGNLRREFTKDQLAGKHHAKLYPELNKMFLDECGKLRRGPSDLFRIILEDRYYGTEVHYPASVEAKPHNNERRTRPRKNTEVA